MDFALNYKKSSFEIFCQKRKKMQKRKKYQGQKEINYGGIFFGATFWKKNDKKISQFLFFVIFFRLTADGGGGCFPEKKINSSEQKKVTLIFSPNSLNDWLCTNMKTERTWPTP